ncbi:MAG: hypothetical protein EZS28_000931 [Streblomastix strix]|uniref:Uncharacterized protein n=1 Tax=Streblomastix strix TaxID=222440 RepID=A0A5J4X8G9_9EUKA|nr:MAG: hypothetical protein EZS28_000931 [Streblomastix strix]
MMKNIQQQFASHSNNLVRERYDERRTNDPRERPTEQFFVWLTGLRENFQQSSSNFIHLFQPENSKQADQTNIRTRLEILDETLVVKSATVNTVIHAFSTDQATQRIDGRTINVFTHHSPDSKMNKKFYIFAVIKEQDSIASALKSNHGMKQATQIISKQRGDARVSEGYELQQSPQVDDLQLSTQETLVSPLSRPIISTQLFVEVDSRKDHDSAKDQKLQMQNDEIHLKSHDEAQDSSFTKDSERATTARAYK